MEWKTVAVQGVDTCMARRTFTSEEFAQMVNKRIRTLYSWNESGKLIAKKDFSGNYFYTPEDYEKVMNRPFVEEEWKHILC